MLTGSSLAQDGLRQDTIIRKNHKHLKALGTVTLQNVLLNRVNRYLLTTGRDWANISLESWKVTLTTAPSWDWDLFITNWFGHPYQGAMYYNGARTLGLSFYESTFYTVLGTAMWEFLGETYTASTNDLIANTIGGFHLGEIFYRLSENVLDDRTNGGERIGREVFAGLINVNGSVNRLIYGDAFKMHQHIGHMRTPIRSTLHVSNLVSLNDYTNTFYPLIGAKFKYGDYTKIKKSVSPYDFFDISIWFRIDTNKQAESSASQNIKAYFNLSSYAILYGNYNVSPSGNNTLSGIFQHYDYLKNNDFELSSFALTYGFVNKSISKRSFLNLQAGIIALGSANSKSVELISPIENIGMERDYIIGSGINTKLEFSKYIISELKFTAKHSFYKLYTLSGLDGSETIHRFSSELGYDVSSKLNISIACNNHFTQGNYQEKNISFSSEKKYSDFRINAFLNL